MDDFWGMEFDWFALDSAGNIGIFCFGGYGFIPEAVLAHHESHKLIAAAIPLPKAGSIQVWGDYANHGLFVFDWKTYEGPYCRMAEPTKLLDETVRLKILQIEGLPILSYNFHDKSTVSVAEL